VECVFGIDLGSKIMTTSEIKKILQYHKSGWIYNTNTPNKLSSETRIIAGLSELFYSLLLQNSGYIG
jgi:hypothetical protein